MPTLSKIAKNGTVLSVAAFGLGAAIYLVKDLMQSGNNRDYMNAFAAGAAVVGLGGGILYYACRQMGCECVSDGPSESSEQLISKSYEKEAESNPLLLYSAEHTHHHPLVQQLLDETFTLPNHKMMASSSESCTFLMIFARAISAKKALDVGVFTGLSTLSLGIGIGDGGSVVSCEINDGEEIKLAQKYWKAAGITNMVDLRLQPARDTLQELIDAGESGSYDIAFIDADKTNYTTYFRMCYRLLRPGGVMIVDNTLWGGKVIDPKKNDDCTVAIRQLNEEVISDDRVRSVQLLLGDGTTVIQKL